MTRGSPQGPAKASATLGEGGAAEPGALAPGAAVRSGGDGVGPATALGEAPVLGALGAAVALGAVVLGSLRSRLPHALGESAISERSPRIEVARGGCTARP
jgi:hypothetical protein